MTARSGRYRKVAPVFRKPATDAVFELARSWLSCQRMGTKHKNGVVSRRSGKAAARKTRSIVAKLGGLPGRTKRFVKSNPVRMIVGMAALGLIVVKLKNLVF